MYIRETEETCDIVKRILLHIKRKLNIIKVDYKEDNKMCYLPVFKETKLSKHRVKRISNKINSLLEREGISNIVLSEYLNNNQMLKNYLYSKNINILDGRFLFKCLTYQIIEHIFKIKNKAMEFRRSFIAN